MKNLPCWLLASLWSDALGVTTIQSNPIQLMHPSNRHLALSVWVFYSCSKCLKVPMINDDQWWAQGWNATYLKKKTFTQNNNNHTKKITFSMCSPLRFWRQLWEFRRYFSFVSLLTHSEDTTVKTIYCLWANGARLTLRWNGTSLLRKCEKLVT